MKAVWLIIVLCLSSVTPLKFVEGQQCSGPLPLTQIKKSLAIPMRDDALALEVRTCGLDFTPTADLIETLRRDGAGAKTIEAIRAFLPKRVRPREPLSSPTTLIPTPIPPGALSFVEKFGDGVSLEMVRIPSGQFLMGSPNGEGGDNERPQHRVSVRSFFMGKYEVTQGLWRAVMGTDPGALHGGPSFKSGDDLPVQYILKSEARKFCSKLSELTGKAYRLPTEAEWEYACRAGTTGNYAGNLDAMAWHGDNSGGAVHPVGQKQPNAFGLHDMHGNVWEKCEDIWHGNYNGAPTDGSAWMTDGESFSELMRGGSAELSSGDAITIAMLGSKAERHNNDAYRSAQRLSVLANRRAPYQGFRVVAEERTK